MSQLSPGTEPTGALVPPGRENESYRKQIDWWDPAGFWGLML